MRCSRRILFGVDSVPPVFSAILTIMLNLHFCRLSDLCQWLCSIWNNTYLSITNAATAPCQNCRVTLNNCRTCSSTTNCTECDAGFNRVTATIPVTGSSSSFIDFRRIFMLTQLQLYPLMPNLWYHLEMSHLYQQPVWNRLDCQYSFILPLADNHCVFCARTCTSCTAGFYLPDGSRNFCIYNFSQHLMHIMFRLHSQLRHLLWRTISLCLYELLDWYLDGPFHMYGLINIV